MKKCIMAIMAHADDMEVFAGGTMAKFTDQGYEGVLVLLTASMAGAAVGGKGYSQTTPDDVIPLRDAEARKAAAILGVHTVERLNFQNTLYSDGTDFVRLGDEQFDPRHPLTGPLLPAVAINPRLIAPVIDAIRRYEPEIVIAQHFVSGFEHLCAVQIVNQAFRQAMAQGVSLGQLWLPVAARHCSWESDIRIYPSPNVLIDISAYGDRKEQALLAHDSQRLQEALEKLRLIDRYWGVARQCERAEPFFTLCDARYR